MDTLTVKERSRLRRLLREFARAKANDWQDDMVILEEDINLLMRKVKA